MMVEKGNVDKHRTTYSGGVKAQESQKWGRGAARQRYGSLDFDKKGAPMPPDKSFPQFKEDQRGSDWGDDTANDWRRGGGKGGEGKPFFDSRGKDGKPDKW